MKALKGAGIFLVLAWMAFVAHQARLARHYAEMACANTLDIQNQIDIAFKARRPDLLGKFNADVIQACH